jgi:hypothetical protein
MAKGDFVFAGANDSTYSSDDFKKGKHHEADDKVAGITVLFLFVTIKLEKKFVKKKGGGEDESDEKPATEEKEKGTKDREKSDERTVCICKASITDYSLQGNVYVDKDVAPGNPRLGVTIHEYIHLWHDRTRWDDHKKELDTLLDSREYECKDDCKSQIIQDVFDWLESTFYVDPKDEEERTRIFEQKLEQGIAAGADPAQTLKGLFGAEKLDASAKDAKPDKDLPVKGRFSSRVIPTWDGSCA